MLINTKLVFFNCSIKCQVPVTLSLSVPSFLVIYSKKHVQKCSPFKPFLPRVDGLHENLGLSSNLSRGILWNLVQNASIYILYVYNSGILNKITSNQNYYYLHHYFSYWVFTWIGRLGFRRLSLCRAVGLGHFNADGNGKEHSFGETNIKFCWQMFESRALMRALHELLTSLSLSSFFLSRSFIIMDGSCEMVQQK